MTPGEIHNTKRQNFITKSRLYFDYLQTEFHFNGPTYSYYKQPNGSVITDTFEFDHSSNHLKISIKNAYHPADYGFEIKVTDLRSGMTDMIHYILKEDQDVDQTYLQRAAAVLRHWLRTWSGGEIDDK